MKRQIASALLACAFLAAQAIAQEPSGETPEWRLVVTLRGAAAECAIRNVLLYPETQDRTNPKWIEAAKKSRACVDAALPKGRAAYRTALQVAPTSKPVLAKAYASWMTYMDTLDVPLETEDQASTEAAFEAAISEIRAELDAR